MIVAVLIRPYPTPELIVGPFDSEEQLVEWCQRMRVNVGIGEVVDPSTFDGDRDRLWVHGTRYDFPTKENNS